MARTKNISGRSRTTPTTRAVPNTAGAANTKAKKLKGKAASRQVSQPPEQPSPRRKRLTTKAAAAGAAVTTRSSPVSSTRAATPTISPPSASEVPLLPDVNHPVAPTSTPGPTRTLRPRTPRAQPYTKPSPKARRKPARSSTPALSLDTDETSEDDSVGPVTPASTPTRPRVRSFGGSPLPTSRTPIGKSPLSKCVMTAEDLETAHPPPAHIDSAPARVSNRGTLLAAPLLLSMTWGIRFSGVGDDELAAATTLVHLRELQQSRATVASVASPASGLPVPV